MEHLIGCGLEIGKISPNTLHRLRSSFWQWCGIKYTTETVGVRTIEGRQRLRARVHIRRRLPGSSKNEVEVIVNCVGYPLANISGSVICSKWANSTFIGTH